MKNRTFVPTQEQMFYQAQRNIADLNEGVMDMIRNGEITNADLAALIKKRPATYGRFDGFLGKLPDSI